MNFGGMAIPDSMTHKGKILNADGKSQFNFTFSQDLPVSVSVYREQDETIVELIEQFDPTDQDVARKLLLRQYERADPYMINLKLGAGAGTLWRQWTARWN